MNSTNNYLYVAYSYGYEENLIEVCDLLTSLKIPHKHYTKGEKYSDEELLKSSGVIFILSDFEWEHDIDELTTGIKGELCKALTNKLPIYIAYKRQSDDVLGIYQAIVTPDSNKEFVTISGIRSTGIYKGGSREFQFASKPEDNSIRLFNLDLDNQEELLLYFV